MTGGRIGLFGGSFNPPHLAHLIVAEAARDQAGLDQVIWIPAAESPFKADQARPGAHHRLEMVRRAIAGNSAFAVDDLEIERGGISYTADTVEELSRRLPDASLFLIIGGDSLRTFPEWHRPRDVLRHASLLVYRRPADEVELQHLPDWLLEKTGFVDAPALDISATEIRRRVDAQRSIRYLVPDGVAQYIAAEGLYLDSGDEG